MLTLPMHVRAANPKRLPKPANDNKPLFDGPAPLPAACCAFAAEG
jgi:hypothetical protein